MKQRDLVDWTLESAPEAGESEEPTAGQPGAVAQAPAAVKGPLRRLPLWAWLALAGVGLGVALLWLGLPRVEAARTRVAIQAVVEAEDQARLRGDWTALPALLDADAGDWAAQQVDRRQSDAFPLAAMLPAPQAPPGPGRLGALTILSPQLARAEVIRSYTLTGGRRADFGATQFYHFAAGRWGRTPPPGDGGEFVTVRGQRVSVRYYAPDAALASEMLVELDALLARACDEWRCPPGTGGVNVAFYTGPRFDLAGFEAPAAQDLFGSLTFQLLPYEAGMSPADVVALPSAAGGLYPADALARAEVKRRVAVQALLRVARQHLPAAQRHGRVNAFLYALVARQMARLGLEPAELASATVANPLFTADQLWSLPGITAETRAGLPEALAALNVLLAAQPPAVELRLLRTVTTASDAGNWLANALGVPEPEASARLERALHTGFPLLLPRAWPPDAALALACPAGPLLATPAGQTEPFLDGYYPGSAVDGWSPGGEWLALSVGGRRGIVDLSAGTGQWTPVLAGPFAAKSAWVSENVLAYTGIEVSPGDLGDRVLRTLGAQFFDGADPGHTFEPLRLFNQYLPAPRGGWGALISWGSGVRPALALMPPTGGKPLYPFGRPPPADTGTRAQPLPGLDSPAWSPDGRWLAFERYDASIGANTLVIASVPPAEQHVILTDRQPRSPAPLEAGPSGLIPAWSPLGKQLAVVALSDDTRQDGWVALVATDGTELHTLVLPDIGLSPHTAAYSGDGSTLAVGLTGQDGQRATALYDPASGELLRVLTGLLPAGWAPAGHSLALAGLDGLRLQREPGGAPEPLGPAGCSGVAWRSL